jgi:hypothetical protein
MSEEPKTSLESTESTVATDAENAMGNLASDLQATESETDGDESWLLSEVLKAEATRQEYERKLSELSERERALEEAERQAQTERAEQRLALERELSDARRIADDEITSRRTAALVETERMAADLRATRLAETEAAVEAERSRVMAAITRERAAWDEERSAQRLVLDEEHKMLEELRGKLSSQAGEIARRTAELQDRECALEAQEERARSRLRRRSESLDAEVESLVAEYKATADAERAAMAEENERLRHSLKTQEELLSVYQELERRLGGDSPERVLLEMNSRIEEIRRLREELATRPTEELRRRYEEIEREMRSRDARIEELQRQARANEESARQANGLRLQLQEARAQSAASDRRAQIFETSANQAVAELNKLQADFERLYGTPAGEDERREEIEMPYIQRSDASLPATEPDLDEIEWLAGIYDACEDYGLHFNRRLLYAFHTALKTAEWAPLTVLAGVSGTGKSELPRLYSHFGGLYFAPVSVQPNWDSQESMLGFFNSIDNRFDAQPVLNFLAQTQKEWEAENGGYPGLRESMCLVLLDEMNLAHPELYFAEFLSKLELRRGSKGSQVPKLDVKIGSGMRPYKLPLSRNVLWVGTMNQDETTKSLSDKVLDRSIVMHFPRPTVLKRRQVLKPLTKENRGAILSRRTWYGWWQQESTFTDAEIAPYKKFIEDMNMSLGVAGRAIGHRVWQSVEYYMSNYPSVISAVEDKRAKAEAMHIAFEDQLVQKVMPKLRGIDTRGKSRTDCLDRIREQIITGVNGTPFDLVEDFDLSCELGYGQFIWQSANYLKEDEPTTGEAEE